MKLEKGEFISIYHEKQFERPGGIDIFNKIIL